MSVLNDIKLKAKELLEKGDVDVVIGYAKGTLNGKCTPYFVRNANDVENLVWENGCDINLANYLLKISDKAAVIAKGCDTRSIVNLVKENQLDRERVVIIGASCPSTESCQKCNHPDPVIADVFLQGETKVSNDDFSDLESFSKLPSEERRNYIYKEVSKCIRCYACRNVCPACYCEECFVEENLPAWIGKTTNTSDNMIFHLTRAIHVAGRCVGCGECVRACPMGVDLSILNRKIMKDVKELFNVESGLELDTKLPLNDYKEDDPQHFLIGGEKCE